jgi:hypothetical protein
MSVKTIVIDKVKGSYLYRLDADDSFFRASLAGGRGRGSLEWQEQDADG